MMQNNIFKIATDSLSKIMLTGAMYILAEKIDFCQYLNFVKFALCSHKIGYTESFLVLQTATAFTNIIYGGLKNSGTSAFTFLTHFCKFQHETIPKEKTGIFDPVFQALF